MMQFPIDVLIEAESSNKSIDASYSHGVADCGQLVPICNLLSGAWKINLFFQRMKT